MLVGDLIYNDDFECNCNYAIYDCTEEGKQYGDGAECIFSTAKNGCGKPLATILDMKIKYITVDISNGCMIIEGTRRN